MRSRGHEAAVRRRAPSGDAAVEVARWRQRHADGSRSRELLGDEAGVEVAGEEARVLRSAADGRRCCDETPWMSNSSSASRIAAIASSRSAPWVMSLAIIGS